MKKKKAKKNTEKVKKVSWLALPEEAKKWVLGGVLLLLAIILFLSFFGQAGLAGRFLNSSSSRLLGEVKWLAPLVLVLAGFSFFFSKYKNFIGPLVLAAFLFIAGAAGISHLLRDRVQAGGWLGQGLTFPFLKLFGPLVAKIIFGGAALAGTFIFWRLLKQPASKEPLKEQAPKSSSFIKKIFAPTFKVKEVEPILSQAQTQAKARSANAPALELKTSKVPAALSGIEYQKPPLDLLEPEKGVPSAGDIRANAAMIKKTLENFEIPVEMSEINIGPTVTQYTFKPADGIKLSKITGLSNDLALALAAHPIRIEAPVPGKPLVGIEVPNKARAQVRLRDLISSPQFQNAPNLAICLGRDVSGAALFADLARMPHLLVAGATGTGKTVFLNSLILSLLYRNSPEILRFILIDPKRVEFPVYKDIPHLLAPVIYDAQKTVIALKWTTAEMERRFELLAGEEARDIAGYNEKALANSTEVLPYIVVVIDELADLMAARGKDIEAGIVRLAQMARAVGIHLVVATQRPSVEVITGLIKANITSRVTFQVASQVDSRTVLDVAGAEKLLGLGDLLFVSAEVVKPKRIQGAYVSEKEVRRVVSYIKSKVKVQELETENELEEVLLHDLQASSDGQSAANGFYEGEDPLYEEAKKIVLGAKKASASFLQRKLRMGYARAARLLDILEQRGVVGPADGAKPREVYFASQDSAVSQSSPSDSEMNEEGGEEENEWHKV